MQTNASIVTPVLDALAALDSVRDRLDRLDHGELVLARTALIEVLAQTAVSLRAVDARLADAA